MQTGTATQPPDIQVDALEREEFELEQEILEAIRSGGIPSRFVIPTDYEIAQRGEPTDGGQFIKIGSNGRPYFPDYPVRGRPFPVIPKELLEDHFNSQHEKECRCSTCSQIEFVTPPEIDFDERNLIAAGLQKYLGIVRRLEGVRDRLASLKKGNDERQTDHSAQLIANDGRALKEPDEIAAELYPNDRTKQRIAALFLAEPSRTTYLLCEDMDKINEAANVPYKSLWGDSWAESYEGEDKGNCEKYFSLIRKKVREYLVSATKQIT